MPDGKRNSLPPEGETDDFYDDELQNATGLRRKTPLIPNTQSLNKLNDRLLKAMVANEIKKTLNGEDNKRLVAHHLPVLHPETEAGDGDMVVVGVVLNSKQTQNEEVSKALEMLRRNGVNCVCFKLNDTLQNGEKKDEPNLLSGGRKDSGNTLKSQVNEDELSPEETELSPTTQKVSSPTVSTTSDYASPPPPASESDKVDLLDTSCSSTTAPVQTPNANEDEENREIYLYPKKNTRTNRRKTSKSAQIESSETQEPSILSSTSPSLAEETSKVTTEDLRETTDKEEEDEELLPVTESDTTSLKKRKRRKRMCPYVARRKPKTKRKRVAVMASKIKEESLDDETPEMDLVAEPIGAPTSISTETELDKKADPYEFEESDFESTSVTTFKTPSARGVPVNASKNKASATLALLATTFGKSKNTKRSPRKRLTFSKPRAFSPDITDHINSVKKSPSDERVEQNSEEICAPTETCVQPISKDSCTVLSPQPPSKEQEKVKLVFQKEENDQCQTTSNCDGTLPSESASTGKECDIKVEEAANEETSLNSESSQTKEAGVKASAVRNGEFIAPAPPDDSLPDAPDSMQLRRSSFYSSISRNVRTNFEKYLDGRPPDLKPAKLSKKVKNGFLLHHGDNFPEDPEAPYRLHLATQVLLKLNKRRVKCKPKEDKGKSLLSYLKLQPKRVSRVGKNSKTSYEESEDSTATEPTSVFSGEWTVPRKFICNICGQVEDDFWDMVMHKGEVHPHIVVTHVELSDNPPEGFRRPPSPRVCTTLLTPPPCTKCSATFTSYPDLHKHIFECAGNAAVLEEPADAKVQTATKKKKGKRKRGFKRRITGVSKKNSSPAKNPVSAQQKAGEVTKRRNSDVFKCEFCTREFKTEGWLKNHISLSHSLPVSIPLNKLSPPGRASISSSRRFTAQVNKPSKQLSRET